MKIGLLAYHSACNFGANLQLLSTIQFFKNKGFEPIVINWIPENLASSYSKSIPSIQQKVHLSFREKHYNESVLCRTSKDVANFLQKEQISVVVIGSDAVAQHHPFLSRIGFPSRRIISFNTYTDDRMFPNVFWGDFIKYLDRKVTLIVMSASCQNSAYTLFSSDLKERMYKAISNYSYLSVRDDWTQKMYANISCGKIIPPVTPDPVFAFNYNVDFVPTKEDIMQKYGLPDKYILFSFLNEHTVTLKWLESMNTLAHNDGYTTVALPFPKGILFNNFLDIQINIPLDPLDWYALIKYSSGYVGHNMHPIVVALHNSVPFYSFDNYGVVKFGFLVKEHSSKIYHILSKAGFLNNRTCARTIFNKMPKASEVYDRIKSFDKDNCSKFAHDYHQLYETMMDSIISKF